MNKQEFLSELGKKLSGLSRSDVEEGLNFYSEMIDDRMEEGMSEEAAVAAIGPLDEIAAPFLERVSAAPEKEEKPRRKKTWRAWEMTLLAVGSPVWVSLVIAAVAVLFSLWVSAWAVVISLWASFGALVTGAVGGLLGGIGSLIFGHGAQGIALIAAGLVAAGLAIFSFYAWKAATKGMIALTRRLAMNIKRCLTREGRP